MNQSMGSSAVFFIVIIAILIIGYVLFVDRPDEAVGPVSVGDVQGLWGVEKTIYLDSTTGEVVSEKRGGEKFSGVFAFLGRGACFELNTIGSNTFCNGPYQSYTIENGVIFINYKRSIVEVRKKGDKLEMFFPPATKMILFQISSVPPQVIN